MWSVAGSESSSARAASVARPPTAPDRSRPPTPRTWVTRTPASSRRQVRCCAPVPDAATTPTPGPGRSGRRTFENPSPTPPTIAVPQSGPITSTPAPRGRVLESDLLRERDVVGEQENVPAGGDRIERGCQRCGTGRGDRNDRVVRARGARRADRAWRGPFCGGGAGGTGVSRPEGGLHLLGGAVHRRLVLGGDGDEQIVRARLRYIEPECCRQVSVQRRGHRDLRRGHARDVRGRLRRPQQRHRVVVLAGTHLDVAHRRCHRRDADRSVAPLVGSLVLLRFMSCRSLVPLRRSPLASGHHSSRRPALRSRRATVHHVAPLVTAPTGRSVARRGPVGGCRVEASARARPVARSAPLV